MSSHYPAGAERTEVHREYKKPLMKLDILAIGVHPDDVELGCGGTLMKQIALGYKVGICDLTRGELGTRGTAETRKEEAAAAAVIMGIDIRENLGFEDGFYTNDKQHQLQLMRIIRHYRPDVVFTNAVCDRHPDHGKTAEFTRHVCFLSGLPKIETDMNGVQQAAHRPRAVYHYIQAQHIEPHFVIDVSPYFERKMQAILAYKTQFYDPDSAEPNTFISSPQFLEFTKARAIHFGYPCGFQYGEGFTLSRSPGVGDVLSLV